jgi:hypothetical protein
MWREANVLINVLAAEAVIPHLAYNFTVRPIPKISFNWFFLITSSS